MDVRRPGRRESRRRPRVPDFQNTSQFLPLYRRQHDDTLQLVTVREQAGKTRLADNHRQVAANLERVIAALEGIDRGPSDAR